MWPAGPAAGSPCTLSAIDVVSECRRARELFDMPGSRDLIFAQSGQAICHVDGGLRALVPAALIFCQLWEGVGAGTLLGGLRVIERAFCISA
jgi:hypothetical protein